MDNEEARALLKHQLGKYQEWTYDELRALVDAPKRVLQALGPSGTRYYIDIHTTWEDRPGDNVRVVGCIDDGGWRAFLPMTEVFVRAPDGSTYEG